MPYLALLVTSLVVAVPPDAAALSPDLKTYQWLSATAGKDSHAQINLALWCESHGLSAERTVHLARAVISDPENATARALLGLVLFQGRWKLAEKIAEQDQPNEELKAKLVEYRARRAKLADRQIELRRADDRHEFTSGHDDAYSLRLKTDREISAASITASGKPTTAGPWPGNSSLATLFEPSAPSPA